MLQFDQLTDFGQSATTVHEGRQVPVVVLLWLLHVLPVGHEMVALHEVAHQPGGRASASHAAGHFPAVGGPDTHVPVGIGGTVHAPPRVVCAFESHVYVMPLRHAAPPHATLVGVPLTATLHAHAQVPLVPEVPLPELPPPGAGVVVLLQARRSTEATAVASAMFLIGY